MEIRETSGAGEARRAAARAAREDFGLVVAAGGDGTVHEVVNGLMAGDVDARPALGVLPLGTANDFARSLDLPQDLEGAVDVLREGRPRPMDVGEIVRPEPHHFINVAVGGFSGRLRAHVDEERKRAWGLLAYVRSAAEALPELEAYRVTVEVDGRSETLDVYQVIVANGRRTGGNIAVAPEARLDDGLLDLVLIRAVDPAELVVLGPQLLLGQHLDNEAVEARRAERVSLRSEPRMRFRADGEEIGEDPVEFRVLPGALAVMAARSG